MGRKKKPDLTSIDCLLNPPPVEVDQFLNLPGVKWLQAAEELATEEQRAEITRYFQKIFFDFAQKCRIKIRNNIKKSNRADLLNKALAIDPEKGTGYQKIFIEELLKEIDRYKSPERDAILLLIDKITSAAPRIKRSHLSRRVKDYAELKGMKISERTIQRYIKQYFNP